MNNELWIFIEHVEPDALGLLSKLRSLGDSHGKTVTAIIHERCDAAPVFSGGASKVYRLLGKGDERQISLQIAALCKEHAPEVLVFLATISCRNIAAMLAAKLETGLSADCTDIALRHDNVLVQTRPTFGGLLFADIICETRRPQIATVRPGIFLPGQGVFPVSEITYDVPESEIEACTKLLSVKSTGLQPLPAARIVISGGKGIESPAGMQLLQKFAALIGASIAASRGAVGAGYAQYRCQVGLTGQTIRPDIYIAIGISGAVQHLVGMEGSKTIVAINSDKNAPIFEFADIGIVSDWKPIVQKLIAVFET